LNHALHKKHTEQESEHFLISSVILACFHAEIPVNPNKFFKKLVGVLGSCFALCKMLTPIKTPSRKHNSDKNPQKIIY
jgi:hypothetical protein